MTLRYIMFYLALNYVADTSIPHSFSCSVNRANEEANRCEQIFTQESILLK